MKTIERQILEVIVIMTLIVGFIVLCATSVVAQKAQIRAMSLSDLIGSDDEIECFAHFFNVKPESLRGYINEKGQKISGLIEDYKMVFEDELRNAGYIPGAITDHINFVVPFDKNGFIVKWEDFADPNRHEWDLPRVKIIGRHHEKVVFHYDVEE